MDWLIKADKYFFSIINVKGQNAFFDGFMPFMRSSAFWVPLYLFLVVFILFNFKKGLWFVLFAVCTVAVSDLISSSVIKQTIFRLRPCRDPEMAGLVHFIVPHCGANSSFTSSHAANHFGLATFIAVVLHPFFRRWVYVGYVWAFLICYAQVYVGVHYPLDILAGAGVGVGAGLLTARVFTDRVRSFALLN